MKLSHLIPALALVTLPLAGCDKEVDPAQKDACQAFATHLATVIQTEQGEQVPDAQVDKMVVATVETCLEAPPSDEQMKCAMAAQDLKAMKACDPQDDDKKSE